jgi:hypothetical protein
VDETWTGTKQKRIARFEGNRVYLSTTPSVDLTGTMSTRTMTWEKVIGPNRALGPTTKTVARPIVFWCGGSLDERYQPLRKARQPSQ